MLRLPLFIFLGSGLFALNVVAQTPGTFVPTGSMATPRIDYRATLLNDGRVLITGGYDGQGLAGAELYDPSSGTFTSGGTMTSPRYGHTATLLNDGRVLIAGGSYGRGPSAELYDPSTGTFTPTGSMVTADQYLHSATLLGNGKVLISGGGFQVPNSPQSYRVVPAPPELYDPVTGTFTPAGGGKLTILGSLATLLNNGKVLLGGYQSGTPLYDPAGDSFTFLPFLFLAGHTATSLTNGTVLIAGGWSPVPDDDPPAVGTAQIYNPSFGSLGSTGSLLEGRVGHSATLLPGGLVLVAGGEDSSHVLASAELYDRATGTFTHTGAMSMSRIRHTATLLGDGRVLILGGAPDTTAELYVPLVRVASAASLTGPLALESLGSLFGSGLANKTESADPLSPPTTLGGISLRVRDSSGATSLAPLLYVSPSQINFEVPMGTALGSVALEVLNAPSELSKVEAQVNLVAPGLFASEDNTPVAYAVRLEPSGKQTALSVRNTIVLDDRPVSLVLYATGVRNLPADLADIRCTVGGTSVPVEYAGPERSGWLTGVDQINIRLTPDLKGFGVSNLMVMVDGTLSNTVSVDIR